MLDFLPLTLQREIVEQRIQLALDPLRAAAGDLDGMPAPSPVQHRNSDDEREDNPRASDNQHFATPRIPPVTAINILMFHH